MHSRRKKLDGIICIRQIDVASTNTHADASPGRAHEWKNGTNKRNKICIDTKREGDAAEVRRERKERKWGKGERDYGAQCIYYVIKIL